MTKSMDNVFGIEWGADPNFSSNRPTGPIWSSSRDVHVLVLSCLSPFHVLDFEAYFAPTSRSRMSKFFRDSESLRNFFFYCHFLESEMMWNYYFWTIQKILKISKLQGNKFLSKSFLPVFFIIFHDFFICSKFFLIYYYFWGFYNFFEK